MAKLVTLNSRMTRRLCRKLGIPMSAAGRKLLPRMARRLGLHVRPGDFVEVEVDEGDGHAPPFIASRSGDVPQVELVLRLTGKTLALVRRKLGLADDATSDEVGAAIVDHFSADDGGDASAQPDRGGRSIGTLGGQPRHGPSQSAARAAATMMSRANLKRFLFARAKKAEGRGADADADELSIIRAETEIWARQRQAGGAVSGPDPLEVAVEQLERLQRLTDDCGLSHADAVKMLRDVDAKNARHEKQRETTSADQGVADPFNVLGLTPMGRMMLSTLHVPNATKGGAVHGFSAKIS